GRVDGDALVVIALCRKSLIGAENAHVGFVGVVGGHARLDGIEVCGGNADMCPVLSKVLGGVNAIETAVGIRDQGIHPALICQVHRAVTSEERRDDRDTSFSAIGSVGRCVNQ